MTVLDGCILSFTKSLDSFSPVISTANISFTTEQQYFSKRFLQDIMKSCVELPTLKGLACSADLYKPYLADGVFPFSRNRLMHPPYRTFLDI